MTKICIASSGLGHVARGIESWAEDLGKALASRQQDIIVCKGAGEAASEIERVVPCWTRESIRTRTLLRVVPRRIGWRMGLGSGYGVEQCTFARGLIRLLKSEAIDILHVQDPFVALRVQSAAARGRLPTRTILAHGTEESPDFQSRFIYLQQLAPWHLEQARAAGVQKQTWTSIPNFVDTDRFSPGEAASLRRELQIPDKGRIILTAAAIKRHHKRIDFLIDAFDRLCRCNPDLSLWLVIAGGWTPETDELVTMAKRQLADRVRFLVQFPRSRMPELYRAADLFTLGSLMEMMPIALLEATASGLPCVVHAHPIMQWMIGDSGTAIDLRDRRAWCETVARLLRNESLRSSLGREARRHCASTFGQEQVVDQILDYYDFVRTDTDQRQGGAWNRSVA